MTNLYDEPMAGSTVLKVTANGQISIPAHVRHRWNTDRVIAIDTPAGLIIRPFDPDAIDRIAGSFKRPGAPSVDEIRRQEREDEARREAARERKRREALRARP
jgi:bifunctional DNA-binding transcriptional regulator/antitoxin component of YhaV-PrlF toxin-antitoxin module